MQKQDDPIIVEQNINALPEVVWKSITTIDLMRKWYFENIPDFSPEPGFKTEFPVQSGGRTFTHIWTVTEVDPERLITYNWRYLEYPGDSFVTFEISGNNDGSSIKLTVNVTEDFPDDIPEFKRESCIGGWEYFIKMRLKDYLESKAV